MWEDSHSVFEFVDAIEAVCDAQKRRDDDFADDEELVEWLWEVSVWMVRNGCDQPTLFAGVGCQAP